MYTFELTNFRDSFGYLEPLYRTHYAEMAERLKSVGVTVSPFNLRLDQYFAASDRGDLISFVVRKESEPVGYCNIYVTNDMHNSDLIAQEDALYVVKEHRNGLGKTLVKVVLAYLKEIGCKRLEVSARTDTRTANLWQRMGFKETARQMTYTFGE